jgi:plastocyanin
MLVRTGLLALALMTPGLAPAATVTIDVRGAGGAPLVDAVVTVEVPGAPRAVPRGSYAMEQKGIAFRPHVLVVPVGATVAFPNRDSVRHHVYSFSKTKRFDLKLYGRDETRSVVFDRPGVVALGCNIHDSMSGFIVVSNSSLVAITDRGGRATIANVPPGAATVRVWSPEIGTSDNGYARPVVVPASGLSTGLAIPR